MIDERKIVDWFLIKNKAEKMLYPDRENMTQLRLMKMMYYAQGVFLAVNDEPLFDDKIVHANLGPMVESLHQEYCGCTKIPESSHAMNNFKELNNDSCVGIVLNAVYEKFADTSTSDIINLTHQQVPWEETKSGQELDPDKLKEYFKEYVIA